MRTFILARSLGEAGVYAKNAGLTARDCTLVSPRTAASLTGLVIREDDLIVEFPGFRDYAGYEQVIETLKVSIRKANDAGPEWVQAGKT